MPRRKVKPKTDLVRTGPIKVSNELTIDSQLRVGGIMYLEKHYDKPIQEVLLGFKKATITGFVPLLVALALQQNKDWDEQTAQGKVADLDLDDFMKAIDRLGGLLDVNISDEKKTAEKSEAKPQ